ncbi:general transcription factor IIF subunit 1-like [Scaptodrosophila lebanonensis]|uniref:Transcription initiation factor IIF subunit alpha n=1 Tax=Drosophila lebanonensis TaxID=7225 RepID=A0A6J2TEH1_DROLE|nr:general transcription factor IIF subunit 1-like [Scaptodrosophila lebanonensis]
MSEEGAAAAETPSTPPSSPTTSRAGSAKKYKVRLSEADICFVAGLNLDEWENVTLQPENTSNAEMLGDENDGDQPWIVTEGGNDGRMLKGTRETEPQNLYLFMEKKDGYIDAFPIKNWYNFQSISNNKTMSNGELEKVLENRKRSFDASSPTAGVLPKRLRLEEEVMDVREEPMEPKEEPLEQEENAPVNGDSFPKEPKQEPLQQAVNASVVVGDGAERDIATPGEGEDSQTSGRNELLPSSSDEESDSSDDSDNSSSEDELESETESESSHIIRSLDTELFLDGSDIDSTDSNTSSTEDETDSGSSLEDGSS